MSIQTAGSKPVPPVDRRPRVVRRFVRPLNRKVSVQMWEDQYGVHHRVQHARHERKRLGLSARQQKKLRRARRLAAGGAE